MTEPSRMESNGRGADRLALLRAQGLAKPPMRALSVKRLHALMPRGLARKARLAKALSGEREAGR
jgi:hypothetical protein